jgi:hypothetical protein
MSEYFKPTSKRPSRLYHLIANEELQTEREDKDLNQSLNGYKQEMKNVAKKNDEFLLMVDDNNVNINGKVVGKKVGRKIKKENKNKIVVIDESEDVVVVDDVLVNNEEDFADFKHAKQLARSLSRGIKSFSIFKKEIFTNFFFFFKILKLKKKLLTLFVVIRQLRLKIHQFINQLDHQDDHL